MPTDLGELHRRQAAVARLAAMGTPASERAGGPAALEVVRRLAPPPVALPAGAQVRAVDDKGRVKPGFALPLSDLLGWEEGGLACQRDGPWLVLTQPGELRGTPRTRNSTCAHLKTAGQERLCLSPAQLHAVMGTQRQVFLAPVPSVGALVVCDPGAFLAGAPPSVARLFEPAGAATALFLVDTSQSVDQPPAQLAGATRPSFRKDHR
ncbi:MAG: hypothetical protein M0Z46_10105 [Actinomycetota bacterium]|nr:hypothetical protein [Actinomycetota bacterium]